MKRSEAIELLVEQFLLRGMASDIGARLAAHEILILLEDKGIKWTNISKEELYPWENE
jgi:hypothetical protein